MPEAVENATQKYSDEVLEKVPARTAKLLNAIGAEPVIRTLMEEAKMSDDDIAEGGKLLLACWGQLPGGKSENDTEEARQQRRAVAELDQWDEPSFGRYGATLQRHFPAAGAYCFHNLSASSGAAAVAGVATFLKRVEALEKGADSERSATKKEDRKAVELLSVRGLDKMERERLSNLVEVALRPTTTLPAKSDNSAQRKAARLEALTALKDWYEEWAAAARAVVKKRSYLIRMGLANRKPPKKGASGKGDEG